MAWEPERIEAIARSMEDQAYWAMVRGGGIAVVFFLLGLASIFGGISWVRGVQAVSVSIGAVLWVFALYVASRAQSEAARLRADAQFVRLGIVLEYNSRRTADALEWLVRQSGGTL